MAVPRNRHSNARKQKKRAHMAKTKVNLMPCSNCKKKILSHRLCPYCGFYAGVQRKSTTVEETS